MDTIKDILKLKENENVEFKSATETISIKGVSDKPRSSVHAYCVALGNEGGGKLILGVSNDKDIVGTNAITEKNVEKVKEQIFSLLGARIEVYISHIESKRVVIIDIPGRPVARVFKYHGRALMRVGEELRDMDDETYRRILLEADDFSSQKKRRSIRFSRCCCDE